MGPTASSPVSSQALSRPSEPVLYIGRAGYTAIVGWLILALFLTVAASTRAQAETQRIALVRTPGDRLIAQRLRAELQALGLSVLELGSETQRGTKSLETYAREHEALAALRATPSKTGVELWVQDPNSGQTKFEELISVGGHRTDELLALRAAEALRARLIRLGVHQQASEALLEPPGQKPLEADSVGASGARRQPVLWVGVSPALTASPGGLDPLLQGQLSLRVEPLRSWSATAFFQAPLSASGLTGAEGEAQVRATLVGLRAGAWIYDSTLRVALGGGALVALVDMEGEAREPYLGQQERLASAAPFASSLLWFPLWEALALRVDALVGVAMPRSVVRFNGRDVATWGRPFMSFSAGLEIAIPGMDRED